jgi:manganese efflux pump family protein
MIELSLLAIALSMDAFAVSIGLGAQHPTDKIKVGLLAGLYFGFFQGLMPLIGYWGGKSLLEWTAVFTSWIAFGLLCAIGGKMIYESSQTDENKFDKKLTHSILLILAIATSIDAMAAGFALNLLDVSILGACLLIGLVTFLFSVVGVYAGNKSGTLLGNKAEFLGGIVLILIGLKIALG